MTVVFSIIAVFFISRVCTSKEEWRETSTCEEEALLVDDCYCRDPCGEKVLYSLFAAVFAVLAIMPWLPAGSRYYATLNAKTSDEQHSEATPENLV